MTYLRGDITAVMIGSCRCSSSEEISTGLTRQETSSPDRTISGLPPARMAAVTCRTAIRSCIVYPSLCAHRSGTSISSLCSEAVVMTACAPRISARCSASTLARPICPERTGITNFAVSLMTITAGSVILSRTYGAMDRTAMPAAEKKRTAAARCGPVNSSLTNFPVSVKSLPERQTFSPGTRSAAYCPASVKHRATAGTTCFPPLISSRNIFTGTPYEIPDRTDRNGHNALPETIRSGSAQFL